MTKTNTAVLISGNGSNLQALIDAAQEEDYPARIGLVISNKSEAYGLERAHKAGVPTVVINHKDYPDRASFDRAMHQQLLDHGIEFVCLAGFMRLLSGEFTRSWQGKMVNIHPSLLPKYKGLEAIKQAYDAGEKESGCTVHWVIEDMDAGEIIHQSPVPILPDDTLETLTQRVHQAEHEAYVAAVRKVLQ